MSSLQPMVHLHVHSYYSVLDGLASVQDLVDNARADRMPGLALTDHGAMFGIKDFTNYVHKSNKGVKSEIKKVETELEHADESARPALQAKLEDLQRQVIKPIIGCECYCAKRGRMSKEQEVDRSGYHLIVLAKNFKGYKNLIKMVSRSYTEGFYYRPRIDKELLEEYHEGLIVTSACLGGEIPQLIMQGRYEDAKSSALWFKELFGEDYYIEIQRHKTDKPRANYETYEEQVKVNEQLVCLARELDIKIVATNDVHFATEEDGEAHDRLICLSTNKDFDDPNRLLYTKQEWLKSTAEMNRIFADIPEALFNTIEILDKVQVYSIENDPLMPFFHIPEPFKDEDEYLRHLSYEGAKKRFGEELSEEVTTRLDFELETIKNMGYPGYFLIVQDLIAQARRLGVSVGPGRGSAAGSLVAYALKITDLDPLRYGLLFERFLNPDRISLPDIDIDFDDDGRQDILEWVTEHYGADHVAHIVTYGKMAAKSAIKDVARVLKLPLAEANALSKMIPDRIEGHKGDVTIKVAIEHVPELKEIYYGHDRAKKEVLDYAMKLEGTLRNLGVHACGIIIGKYPISDIVPTWTTKDNDTGEEILVTQYDGSVIEDTGLIKMDFLGLKTLSIIKEALKNIKQRHGIDVDIDHIPLDDPKVFELFSAGKTHAVFQFESPGMQKSLMQLQPTKFEDLIAMVALYRPGPMDNIPSFIARKHGREPITYDLDVMEEYLEETYGITVYQEQIMLLARKIGNFTRGESDSLRKAMGKKRLQEMALMKDKFLAGGISNGHSEELLEKIWTDWIKFTSYAFNKSHAACYAWVAYQTAYLKAHYPSEFMAGVLSRNVNNISEITKYMAESKKMGIKVLSPDVNESNYFFSVNRVGDIRFGLGAIKGFSRSAATAIVDERNANGPFKDIYDFFERVNGNVSTKKVCESLVLSGAFDSFGEYSREDFLTEQGAREETFLDQLIRYGQKLQVEKHSAQVSLFGEESYSEMTKPILLERAESWSEVELLNKEKELLGIYLTASPLDKYALALKYKCNVQCVQLSDLSGFVNREVTFGGVVIGYRQATTKRGDPCGFIKLQDFSGEGEIALFGEQFAQFAQFGKEGLYIYVTATIEKSRYNDRLFIKVTSIKLFDSVYQGLFSNLDIRIPEWAVDETFFDQFTSIVSELPEGSVKVRLFLSDPSKSLTTVLESEQLSKVEVSMDLMELLEEREKSGVEFVLN